MPYEFKAVRRVEFSETDLAGIVHYANFFRYMETAEHGFFRMLGYSVVMHHFDPPVGWQPRVRAECEYRIPLRFEDEIGDPPARDSRKTKSLTYTFIFRKLNGPQPEEGRARFAHGRVRDQTA